MRRDVRGAAGDTPIAEALRAALTRRRRCTGGARGCAGAESVGRPLVRPLVRVRAPGAARREPPAHRAGRAAPRARASTCSRARPARARPCSPTRSTCCSAAARGRGSCGPGAAEAYVEGVFELPGGAARRARRAAARRRRGGRARPAGERRGAHARLPRTGARRRSATCARSPARCCRLLRPARAPQAHAGLRAARDPRRLLRRGAPGAARGSSRRRYARVRELEATLAELRERAGARERELDLLAFELAEIEAADPSRPRRPSCARARERLRHLEALRGAALGAARGGGARRGRRASPALLAAGGARARRRRRASTRRSTRWPSAGARWPTRPTTSPASCCATPRGSTASPGALEAAEERLAVLDRLERKHGGTIATVLAHAERCRARRDELAGAEVALERGAARARGGAGRAGAGGRGAARGAREGGAAAGRARCASAWPSWRWRARASRSRCEEREPGPTGADAVEFLIAPNPGVPAGPLREIASGGELSRVMLALMGVANDGADGRRSSSTRSTPASAARRRARSARSCARWPRAARSSASPTCRRSPRSPRATSRSRRTARPSRRARRSASWRSGEVVAELVRMLGADADDVAARRHARELLAAA